MQLETLRGAPQRPRASRLGAPGAAPVRARPDAPDGGNGIPSSRAGLWGLWFAPHGGQVLRADGTESARGPPRPPARAHTGHLTPKRLRPPSRRASAPNLNEPRRAPRRLRLAGLKRALQRSPRPVHPGGCSRSAPGEDGGARAHCLQLRGGCACPRSAASLLWPRRARGWFRRARAVCTFRVSIWLAVCGKGHDSRINGEN